MERKYNNSNLPITLLFPNIITIIAICFGFTSIRFALNAQWDIATYFIVIAGILDMLDGRIARLLKATSNFGAQLDSLADLVNFGIAPAIVLYLWNIKDIELNGLGWSIALFYTICQSIRLARFNSSLSDKNLPEWKNGFFTGVPAPAGAYLALMPIMISFKTEIISKTNPLIIGIYLIIIGILMASRIPTFSTKRLVIPKKYISLTLVSIGLIIGAVIVEPWIILPSLGAIYIGSIPLSVRSYLKLSKNF